MKEPGKKQSDPTGHLGPCPSQSWEEAHSTLTWGTIRYHMGGSGYSHETNNVLLRHLIEK